MLIGLTIKSNREKQILRGGESRKPENKIIRETNPSSKAHVWVSEPTKPPFNSCPFDFLFEMRVPFSNRTMGARNQ